MGSFARFSLIALGAAAAAPIASCLDPTEIVVDLSTNVAPLTVQSRGVLVRVGAPGSVDTNPTTTFTTTACGPDGVIGRFVVVPSGSFDDPVAIHVVLGIGDATDTCAASGGSCIQARRQLTFAPHVRLTLPIELDTSCLGIDCGPDATCVDGACVGDTINTDDCDGGTCMPAVDAGNDGGSNDATTALDVANVVDGNPSDVQSDVPCLQTVCNGQCVDLASDGYNCGACGVDCHGGSCTAGVCALDPQITGTCLAVVGASVYVATATGMVQIPTVGGAGTYVSQTTTTALGATRVDVAWYEKTTLSATLHELQLSNPYTEPSTSTASLLAMSDLHGYAWIDYSNGDVYFQKYGGLTPTGPYYSFGKLLKSGGAVALAQTDAYATDGAQLCRIVSAVTQPTCVGSPTLTSANAVVVDDPDSATPHVLVSNEGAVVELDYKLATHAVLVSSLKTNPPPLAAMANDSLQNPNRVYALAGIGGTFTEIDRGPWGGTFTKIADTVDAAPKCIAIDGNAVYWLEKNGGLFKHPK